MLLYDVAEVGTLVLEPKAPSSLPPSLPSSSLPNTTGLNILLLLLPRLPGSASTGWSKLAPFWLPKEPCLP